ncbi:MAG: hypothetical protein OEV34_06330, partial [Gammaproteobacteria bacterium]|nr:hypothetical protein [Gammaproteobacteria bacterium]
MTTDFPAPTLPGQSPGLGDGIPPGCGGAGGAGGAPGAAEDDPQAARDVPIPIAAMVLSIAEPPTARPIDARKSRLAIRVVFKSILPLYAEGQPLAPERQIVIVFSHESTLCDRRNIVRSADSPCFDSWAGVSSNSHPVR